MSPEKNTDAEIPYSRLNPADWDAPGEFERLIGEVREGSEEAAWDLFERVGPHVQRIVHKMINRELRSKFDSLDFVQSVWASFFFNRQSIADFTDPRELIRFLVAMARNKVITEHRRRILTEKYDVRRDRSATTMTPEMEETQVYPEPSPSQFAMARECWHQMVDGKPDIYREVVIRKYMGETHDEIALALRINRRTISRILGRMLPKESA